MGGLALYERGRVELNATGEWWCAGRFCGTSFCDPGKCLAAPKAACYPQRSVMSGEEMEMCWSAMSYCEQAREEALASRDLEGVGRCRIVSATVEDREAYKIHRAIAWTFAGLLGVIVFFFVVARVLWRWWLRGAPE